MKKIKSGFTLIELLIVVVILGILAAVVIPRFSNSSTDAKYKAHATERALHNTNIDIWYNSVGSYPTNFATLIANTAMYPDGASASCNQGTAWAISGTLYRLVTHASHE